MPYPLSSIPESVAARFARGWTAYDVPSVWVEPIERWTTELAEIDPEFTYGVIRENSGSAKVWISGNFENWSGVNPPAETMSLELAEILRSI